MTDEIDIDAIPDEMLNDYALATKTDDPEAVDELGKSEAIFYVANTLTDETPDGNPSGHNGNVTRAQIKQWASILARAADDGVDFSDYTADTDESEADE